MSLRTLLTNDKGNVARIELWNGDICDLEVDAIVSAANVSLWMSDRCGRRNETRRRSSIEFAAVRQAPVPIGGAIVTSAGNLAARAVIHAVSLDRDRRTSGPVIAAAVRSAMARVASGARSVTFSALGPGSAAFPWTRPRRSPCGPSDRNWRHLRLVEHVVLALRGAAAYEAFRLALDEASDPSRRGSRLSFLYGSSDRAA